MSLPLITLEEFATDRLLGNFPEASPAQRLVLRLLDGLPPADAEQRELFETLAGRAWGEDLLSPRRTVAFIMGADSGKSLIAALLLLHRCLFSSLEGLRPGQRAIALLVAPDVRLAGIPLDYVGGIIDSSPLIAAEVSRRTADSIEFLRGTSIKILPATIAGRSVRGWRYVAACLEEVAFFRDADFRINDLEIVRAIRPRLLPGAQIVPISTPWRKSGWLWNLYQSEYGRGLRALVLQASTSVMRPDKSVADMTEVRDEDPVAARSELDALFMENVSAMFDADELREVTDAGVRRRDPDPGWRFVAATDPSGLKHDCWAFTVLGTKDGMYRQFVSRAWRAGTSVERVIDDIRTELTTFGLHSVAADQYASGISEAYFHKAGINLEVRPFTSSPSSPKTLGFRGLRELVVAGRIRLLDDAQMLRELLMLEITRLSGGGERIAAPGRLGDDRACALALACHELRPVSHARLKISVSPERKTTWRSQRPSAFREVLEVEGDSDLGGGILNQDF